MKGIFLLLVALIVTGLAVKGLKKGGGEAQKFAVSIKPAMTETERKLFEQLRAAFPELIVLAQVSLSQVVKIHAKGSEWRNLRNKVAQKSLDFVLCEASMRIVAAIELDDKTHDNEQSRGRDGDKDRVLEATGTPLIRWRAGKTPTTSEMPKLLSEAIVKVKAAV